MAEGEQELIDGEKELRDGEIELEEHQVEYLDKRAEAEGKIADVVVFDPTVEYVIDKNTFYSKGKNTPFHGRKVKGDIRYTLVDGNVVYER